MSEHASHPWAPKAGPRFFFLWMAGAVFAQVTYTAANIVWARTGNPGTSTIVIWLYSIGILETVWCGWLVFRWTLRTLAWTLPMLALSIVNPFTWSNYGFTFVATSILIPGVQYLVLRGVRQKAALWFAVAFSGFLLSAFLPNVLRTGIADRFQATLSTALPAWFPLSIDTSVIAGASVLASAIGGAALAWLMKPIEKPETALREPTLPPRP